MLGDDPMTNCSATRCGAAIFSLLATACGGLPDLPSLGQSRDDKAAGPEPGKPAGQGGRTSPAAMGPTRALRIVSGPPAPPDLVEVASQAIDRSRLFDGCEKLLAVAVSPGRAHWAVSLSDSCEPGSPFIVIVDGVRFGPSGNDVVSHGEGTIDDDGLWHFDFIGDHRWRTSNDNGKMRVDPLPARPKVRKPLKDGQATLMVGGTPYGPYDSVAWPEWSADGSWTTWALLGGSQQLVHFRNGEELRRISAPELFTSDEKRASVANHATLPDGSWAMLARVGTSGDGVQHYALTGSTLHGPLDAIPSHHTKGCHAFAVSPSGRSWACDLFEDVVIDGHMLGDGQRPPEHTSAVGGFEHGLFVATLDETQLRVLEVR